MSRPSPAIKESRLSRDRVVEILTYDPLSGHFLWKLGKRRGQRAGCLLKSGYITIFVDGAGYAAHRLAWIYAQGSWPTDQIDHIDGNKANNATANLREATNSQNGFNKPSRGYSYSPREKQYRASIQVNGKAIWLGYHDTPEAALAAYLKARGKYAGDFAVPRQSNSNSVDSATLDGTPAAQSLPRAPGAAGNYSGRPA